MKALAVGLHDQRSGLRLYDRFLRTGIRMSAQEHVDTVDDAGQFDIRINIPPDFRICLVIGLHGRSFTLVGQQHDQVHVRAQQFHIFRND